MGAIANIDQEGFGSAAFHSFPDMLKPDPLSGDYAQNFLGHALNTAAYLVNDSEFGWQAFGGNVQAEASKVTLRRSIPSASACTWRRSGSGSRWTPDASSAWN